MKNKLKIVAQLRIVRKKVNENKNEEALKLLLSIENKIKKSALTEVRVNLKSPKIKKEIYADIESLQEFLSKIKDVPIEIVRRLEGIRENTIGDYIPDRNDPEFLFYKKRDNL